MSFRSIPVSATISYLSAKFSRKAKPTTQKANGLQQDTESPVSDFAARQDEFFDWTGHNPGRSDPKWRRGWD